MSPVCETCGADMEIVGSAEWCPNCGTIRGSDKPPTLPAMTTIIKNSISEALAELAKIAQDFASEMDERNRSS